MIKNNPGDIVIEEFLKTRAEEIRVNFPEPPSEPKDAHDMILVMQGGMSYCIAAMFLSINSKWN